jgi:hypothetical protein
VNQGSRAPVRAAAFALGLVLACSGLHAAGAITTVVGDGVYGYNGDGILATASEIAGGPDLCLDLSGDIFVADSGNYRIRRVDALTGLISTIAGTGVPGYNGDGIAATAADLEGPGDLRVDSADNIYFSDNGNNRVRMVSALTGLISTLAGDGTAGYNGDGIPATSAELNGPSDVSVDCADNLYVADPGNNRLREVNAILPPCIIPTETPTTTPSPSPSFTVMSSPSLTPSFSATPPPSVTRTITPTGTVTPTFTVSPTVSPTPPPLVLTPHYPNPDPARDGGVWLPTPSTRPPGWICVSMTSRVGRCAPGVATRILSPPETMNACGTNAIHGV